MSSWRLLAMAAADGAANMALDRALLDVLERRLAAGESPRPVLRFYSWRSPTVTTGRHQALDAACDLEACRAEGVDVVQRPTGGRGVLHDDELTYAVIAPGSGPFAGPGVSAAAAAIAEALGAGLSRLGARIDVVKGAPAESPRALRFACFATASRAEVVAGGRKLCGSAQMRGRLAVLQHGSLPLAFDAAKQARLLGSEADFLASRAVGLVETIGRRPAGPELTGALRAGFEETFDARFEESAPDDEELAQAAILEAALRADERRFRAASVR